MDKFNKLFNTIMEEVKASKKNIIKEDEDYWERRDRIEREQTAIPIVERYNLKENADGTYDADGDVIIYKGDLQNGKLPIKFNRVKGDFTYDACFEYLTSLEGSPRWVGGTFTCSNSSIASFVGGPEEVEGDFWAMICRKITTCEGMPKRIEGSVHITCCDNLVSLKGMTQEIGGGLWLDQNYKLESLEGAPEQVYGRKKHWSTSKGKWVDKPGVSSFNYTKIPNSQRSKYRKFLAKNADPEQRAKMRRKTWNKPK